MESLKLLILLLGLDFEHVPKPFYSWAKPNGYGVGLVVRSEKFDYLCFERLENTYAIYSHPGPVIWYRYDQPVPQPWVFKPLYKPGTLERLFPDAR